MSFLKSFTAKLGDTWAAKLGDTWDFITGKPKSGSDITAETPEEIRLKKKLEKEKNAEMVNFVKKSVSANSSKDKKNELLNNVIDYIREKPLETDNGEGKRLSKRKSTKIDEVRVALTKATDDAIKATDDAMKAADVLEIKNDDANNKIIIHNLSVKEKDDRKVAEKLQELIEEFKEKKVGVATLKKTCIEKAVDDLTAQLKIMDPTGTLVEDTSVITDIAESWARDITSASNDPNLNTALKNFIYRMDLASHAFQSQCIFSSKVWKTIRPNPPLQPAPAVDSSTNINIWNWLYSYVNSGPYRYVVGPILDFQNIEGRVFIYVKCYSRDYTRGTYFWVYRSQSEGLYRIFFKLDTHGSIEKGYDYTQGTIDDFRLQVELCEYYERHNKRGLKDPIVINTLGRLNYFMSKMSNLQGPDFLDSFPGAIIQPSVNSVDCRTGMPVTGGFVCDKPLPNEKSKPPGNAANECCYVCLTQDYVCLTQDYALPPPPSTPPTITQSQGMIGHYYMIHDKFASIITKGLPKNLTFSDYYEEPWVSLFGVKVNPPTDEHRRNCQIELNVQLEKYFPSNTADVDHPHYDFSRIQMGYGTTCPYIFCFTTCSLIASCPMFNIFLNSNYYKKTFWCQGFQNYTEKFKSQLGREILSPVLYIAVGAFLEYSDFALSTLQYDLLNNVPYNLRSDPVFRDRNALMTLSTRHYNDKLTSLSLPTKRSRGASARAFTRIQENAEEKYESLGLSYRSEKYKGIDGAVIEIVKENVEKKINMIRCLWNIYIATPVDPVIQPFVYEVKRLERLSTPQVTIPPVHADVTFDSETQRKANKFIADSPEAAAAALFGFISNQKDFRDDLIEYADLCLKENWIRQTMDHEYRASRSGVFDPGRINSSRLNYLGRDGEFHEFTGNVPLPDPANPNSHPNSLYILKSSFDEVRRVDTSPKNLNDTTNPKKYVKVVTFATIYRRDCCYYDDELSVLKSVSIMYQVSSTVVYTREVNPIILYAKDEQIIPLVCVPNLPVALLYLLQEEIEARITELLKPNIEVTNLLLKFKKGERERKPADFLDEINKTLAPPDKKPLMLSPHNQKTINQIIRLLEQQIKLQRRQSLNNYLNSDHTLLCTYGRVMSYGAFVAGKMMEYFFGSENSGFYQLPYFFKNFDKFLKVSSQYDTTALIYSPNVYPYNLLTIPSNLSFPEYIQDYFQRSGIILKTDGVDPDTYIREKLHKTNRDIEAISKHVTSDFHVDSNKLDDDTSSEDSSSQHSSSGHLSSQRSSSGDLLVGTLKSSQDSINDPTFSSPRSSDSIGSSSGGSLYIKTHNFTYKNKTTKPSKKSRKYIHFKNMIKSKVTKPKTYKRRATGIKRKPNPNKTMRRYRRVRK